MSSSEGAHEGWMQSSTCRAVDAAGRTAGRAYGLAESTSRVLAWLLSRQARQKFGATDPAGRATLDGLARAFATDQLGDLAERLVDASSWEQWLAGVVVPPPAAGLPAYTQGLEIDLDPPSASIDSLMVLESPTGARQIIHFRIQKWYQPDLDRLLYEECRKVERKHGIMPTVVVVAMWPPAEGPGMTGRYEDRDASGKLRRTFTYEIRRAWEMSAEEVTQGPGMMMLAPLTKGARERMTEVVRLIRQGLEAKRADAKTREMAWLSAYWSMGLVCELEEAHRALGDLVPLIQNAESYLKVKGRTFLEGYSAAQEEGRRQAGRDLVVRQATRRFGPDPDAAAAISAINEPDALAALAQRVLTAADWRSLLAGP